MDRPVGGRHDGGEPRRRPGASFYVALDAVAVGSIGIDDPIKPTAASAVRTLAAISASTCTC